MTENFPVVMTMDQPLTEEQYDKLRENYSKKAITMTLESLNNIKQLNKIYVSASKAIESQIYKYRKYE